MHDILEGVAQFEVIHAIDYGYNQQRNRPPTVKMHDGSNDLGLNAIVVIW